MSHAITLKSLAELGEALHIEDLPTTDKDDVSEDVTSPAVFPDCGRHLADLVAGLETAAATLATITRRDREARAAALRDLERYDAIVVRQREAEEAQKRASQVRQEAEILSREAYAEEARIRAGEVVAVAVEAEVAAIDTAKHWQHEAEQLAAQLDLERLLEERRRQREAEKAQAAAAETARRLAGTLAQARVALAAGRIEEAKGLLAPLAQENPSHPEINSLRTIIEQRELAVKIDTADTGLWEARRLYRHDPAAAVTRLETLDVGGLPDELARQVFGEWARGCSRLCRQRNLLEPLRYAPEPGRGAVIARDNPDGGYVVVSALGMGAGWQTGSPVGERYLRRARPLR